MKNYDNFFLPAKDLKKSRAFYEKILKLPIKFNFEERGMVGYKIGEQEPAIILKDITKFPSAKPTIWFVVENVKDEYERLKSAGIIFLSEPFRIPTGLAVEFEDPAGNRLGITDYKK
jgi:predicted enzyme related to lactoylglutathione lyase